MPRHVFSWFDMDKTTVSVCVLTPIYSEPDHLILSLFELLTSSKVLPREFCFVDDNPDISRLELVNKIQQLCNILGIQLLYIENEFNIGLTRSLNKALPLISSKYTLRCDADDLSLNDRIHRQYSFMESNSHISLLSGPTLYSNNRSHYQPPQSKLEVLLFSIFGQPYPHSTWFIRSSILSSYLYPDIPVAQDYGLIVRLLLDGHSLAALSGDPIARINISPNSSRISNLRKREQINISLFLSLSFLFSIDPYTVYCQFKHLTNSMYLYPIARLWRSFAHPSLFLFRSLRSLKNSFSIL